MSFHKPLTKIGGFTIVEVMIVLAVGGMIAAVVFMAVPQLQRSGRDSTRKNIANRIKSEMENYAANHEGQYPANNVGSNCSSGATSGDWADFYNNNLKNIKTDDPTTGSPMIDCQPQSTPGDAQHDFVWTWSDAGGSGIDGKLAGQAGVMDIIFGASCKDATVESNSGNGIYSIVMGLEKGNHYCIDNT